ncbi:MAG: hypothetical protein ABJA90_10750 [Ginsengibacter sp.]
MRKLILFFALAFAGTKAFSQCACCAGAGVGSSNGDYNNGILTLPKHIWVAESYGDYRHVKKGNAVEDEEKLLKSMFITSLGLRYGVSDKITISALLPYVFLHTNSGNDNGIGDLILLSTFNIYQHNNFDLALQGGVELPTGIQKNSNFDNTTVVVGSGSVDPMAGIMFSKRWNNLALQGNGLFKYTTPGFQGNYYGSLAVENLSLSYKIKKGSAFCSMDSLDSKSAASNFGWSVFGGYYGEWLDKLKEDKVVDENSGYYMGFATLGTNLSYKQWNFPLTFSLPVISKMNGDQNAGGIRLRLGVIRSF